MFVHFPVCKAVLSSGGSLEAKLGQLYNIEGQCVILCVCPRVSACVCVFVCVRVHVCLAWGCRLLAR